MRRLIAESPDQIARKLRLFARNSVVVVARAKKAAMSPGLHGKTIAPKKNPKLNALTNGFLEIFGVRAAGINLVKSTLKMRSKLIMKSIPNAIGETIVTTVVSDVWSIVVKTRPISSINVTTPATAIRPNKAYVLRSELLP